MVDRVAVDRQARVARLGHGVDDGLRRGVLRDGDDIDPRHHDVARRGFLQAEDVVDHLAFFGFDDAVVLGVVRDQEHLVLGAGRDALRRVAAEGVGQQIRRAVGQRRKGAHEDGDEPGQPKQNTGHGCRSGSRECARDGLPEDEKDQRDDDDGDQDGALAALSDDDEGDQAGGQCDGDRLHELQRGDERAPGVEQGLHASLAVSARGRAESLPADEPRTRFDDGRARHDQKRESRDADEGPTVAGHGRRRLSG